MKAEMLAILDALDHLHATNEEGKALHQADALRVLRGHVNANIVPCSAAPATFMPGSSPSTVPTLRTRFRHPARGTPTL